MMPLYVGGILGNIANILLFSQQRIRMNNACVRYFTALSAGNVLILTVGGPTRSLPFLNGWTPETTSLIFCKCRHFIIHFSLLYMRTLVSIISVDRWMITTSNPSIRRLSTAKRADRTILIVTLVAAFFSVHAPIGFGIRFGLCYAYLNLGYIVFFTIYNILTATVPVVTMIFFSILIMRNVRKTQQRIHPGSMETGNPSQPSLKAAHGSNGQFLRLVLIQSVSFILLNASYALYVVYDAATNSMIKSDDRRALEQFVYALSVHPVYVFCSVRETSGRTLFQMILLADHLLHLHIGLDILSSRMSQHDCALLRGDSTLVSSLIRPLSF